MTPSTRGDGPTLRLGARSYPVVVPTLGDPRLQLASVIVSLHVIGQVALDFRLSIAQILISLGVCALLEVGIAFRRQGVVLWPASALLTGNGVAFILRVPSTEHGDWWSLDGWWIFVAASSVAILSKYLIRFRSRHVFNPSNIGLLVCFLALSETVAEPLDFWWGPMSPGLAAALALIVAGGVVILGRLGLMGLAAGFWLAFAAGVGVLAISGHAMTARWHLGPISGGELWRILVFSPEILVFLFFMITDPRTIPRGRFARLAFGVGVGLLTVLLIAPLTTEYASKVAVLGALALASAALTFGEVVRASGWFVDAMAARPGRILSAIWHLDPGLRRRVTLGALTLAGTAGFIGLLVVAGIPARPAAEVAGAAPRNALPELLVVRSEGVVAELDEGMAQDIVDSARASLGDQFERVDRVRIALEPGALQGPPVVLATLEGSAADAGQRMVTLELVYIDGGFTVVGEREAGEPATTLAQPSNSPSGGAPPSAQTAGEATTEAREKNWVQRSICAQAAADFDKVGAPPMGSDLAAYACDGVGLTGEQFRTQAGAICEEASERLAALSPGEPADIGSSAEHARAVARVDYERAASLRALRALDPPEAEVVGLSRAIELLEALSTLARQASEAAGVGDATERAQGEARYAALAKELRAVWTDVGVARCAR